MADRNGYFQIAVKGDGTYLHVFPCEGIGAPLRVGEISDYFSTRNIKFDLMELDATVKRGEDCVIKINNDNPVVESEAMDIDISEDLMSAKVRFYPPFEGGPLLSREDILSDLKFKGVSFGIKEELVTSFLSNREYCKDYIIAEGIPVREGKDAYIEYLFNTDLSQRPAQNEDGSVDYFNLQNICHCQKGDILARMVPADKGNPGKNIKGVAINPKIPRNVLFQFGKNISKTEDGLAIVSDINGHVSLVEGKVFVSGVLELPNVDPSSGNIDFDGSVSVQGNVQSGFSVKATGDVEVNGVVEGAHIVAGGQIIIRRGINGMGKGLLEAGSNVLSKYIENATIHSGGYVETDCIIHSTVTASSHIVVQGKRGFIIGGAVRAGNYIEAKTLGSDTGSDAFLEVGTDPQQKIRYNNIQKEIADAQKEIARLEPVIRAVGERLGKGEKMSIDQLKQAKVLSTTLAQKKELLKKNLVEAARLEVVFDQTGDASIRVTGEAFPGTKLVISEAKMTLKTPYHYCKFVREGADVVMKALV